MNHSTCSTTVKATSALLTFNQSSRGRQIILWNNTLCKMMIVALSLILPRWWSTWRRRAYKTFPLLWMTCHSSPFKLSLRTLCQLCHSKLFLRREGEGGHLGARTSQSLTLLGHHVQSQTLLSQVHQEEEGGLGEGEGVRTSHSRTLLVHLVQEEVVVEAVVEVVEGDRNHSIFLTPCLVLSLDLRITLPRRLMSAMLRKLEGNDMSHVM